MKSMERLLLLVLLILPIGLAASDWRELPTKLEQSVWASSTYCEEIRGKQVCYPPGIPREPARTLIRIVLPRLL